MEKKKPQDSPPPKPNDPVERFPFEINVQIFAHFNQSQLVNSMTVSRSWSESIPEYNKSAWEEVEFSADSWEDATPIYMLRNLGPHVSKVSIRLVNSTTIPTILRTLSNRRCKIRSLEIQIQPESAVNNKLIDSIVLFRQSLRKLCIRDCRIHDITASHLLLQLPRLTHFTLLIPDMAEQHTLEQEHLLPRIHGSGGGDNGPPQDHHFPKLVYLHLDSYRSRNETVFRQRLLPLLERCPNLQCLITSTTERALRPNTFYFNEIFPLCPRLRYIAWGVPIWIYDSQYPPPENALPLCNGTSIKERYKAIEREFGSVSRPNIPVQTPPNVSLEALTIYGRYVDRNDIRNQATDIVLREHCQNIKYLEVNTCNMDAALLQTVNTAMESFTDNRQRYLRIHYLMTNDRQEYITHTFSSLAQMNSIRYLCFKNLVISGLDLNTISLLPVLNEFHVHFDDPTRPPDHPFDENGLLTFADGLRGNRTLEKLTLTVINSISDEFLNRISHAKKLAVVSISDTSNTSEEGRRAFSNSRTVDGVVRRVELLQHIL